MTLIFAETKDATFFIILQVHISSTENIAISFESSIIKHHLKFWNQRKNKIRSIQFFLRLFVSMNIWQSGVKMAPISIGRKMTNDWKIMSNAPWVARISAIEARWYIVRTRRFQVSPQTRWNVWHVNKIRRFGRVMYSY